MAEYIIPVEASFKFIPHNKDFGGEATLIMMLAYNSPISNKAEKREKVIAQGDSGGMMIPDCKKTLQDENAIKNIAWYAMNEFLKKDWEEMNPAVRPDEQELIDLAARTIYKFEVETGFEKQ